MRKIALGGSGLARAPRLEIFFRGSKNNTLCSLRRFKELSEDEVGAIMLRVEKKHAVHAFEFHKIPGGSPLTTLEMHEPALESLLRFSEAVGPSHLDWESYSFELLKYYHDYEEYLKCKRQHDNLVGRTAVLEFEISNAGAVAATDMNIAMRFPKGVALYSEKDFPAVPMEPEAPKKPAPLYERLASGELRLDEDAAVKPWLPGTTTGPLTAISVRNSESCDISFGVKQLQHLHRIVVGKFYVVFPTLAEAKSFSVDYVAKCQQVDHMATGSLHVQVVKQETA